MRRSPTRARFKLIPRVANVEQWARDAPLSSPEYRLLSNYNDKPVLTRPQQRCRRLPLLLSCLQCFSAQVSAPACSFCACTQSLQRR